MEEEDGDDFADEFGELGIMSEVAIMSVKHWRRCNNMCVGGRSGGYIG